MELIHIIMFKEYMHSYLIQVIHVICHVHHNNIWYLSHQNKTFIKKSQRVQIKDWVQYLKGFKCL